MKDWLESLTIVLIASGILIGIFMFPPLAILSLLLLIPLFSYEVLRDARERSRVTIYKVEDSLPRLNCIVELASETCM